SHISNFRPVKRIRDVILIYNNIQQYFDSELILIGDGPERAQTEELVLELGLKNHVHFLGKSNEIENVLKKSDLFLLPSNSESFGLVALEAMSCGTPVITTRSGGIVELVIDGKTGFTCSVGDVEAMSEKAINLLSNSEQYVNMSVSAFKRAQIYDAKHIIPKYEQCYIKLLN
ncbi:glycosyltransferase, partial [Flavobacteriales bacterium]|nr:glycosyltransferase [Flavobacteriales bacterium]